MRVGPVDKPNREDVPELWTSPPPTVTDPKSHNWLFIRAHNEDGRGDAGRTRKKEKHLHEEEKGETREEER